jgi:hypothetical protein
VNKRCGIALILLSISGVAVALLHLFNAPESLTRYATGGLSALVMLYGIYLAVWLKFYSVGKHAHPEEHSKETNN